MDTGVVWSERYGETREKRQQGQWETKSLEVPAMLTIPNRHVAPLAGERREAPQVASYRSQVTSDKLRAAVLRGGRENKVGDCGRHEAPWPLTHGPRSGLDRARAAWLMG